jgi:hypothetical protein
MIVQSRLSTSGLAATGAGCVQGETSRGILPADPFFGAAAIWVFALSLPNLPFARVLPAQGVDAFAFFLDLAMLRP